MNNPNRPNFGGENLDGQDANSGWNDNFDQGNENVDGQLNNGGVNQEVNNQAEMDQATREELLRTQYEGMDALMDERNTLQERIDLINDRLSQLPENASLDVRETLLREKERLIQARLKNVENRRRLMAGEAPVLDEQAPEQVAEEANGGASENNAAPVENATSENAGQQAPGQTTEMEVVRPEDYKPRKQESYVVEDPPTEEEVQAFVEKGKNKEGKAGVAKFVSYLVRLLPTALAALSLYVGAFALGSKTGGDMDAQQAGITQVDNGDHYIGAVRNVQQLMGYEQNEQFRLTDGYENEGNYRSCHENGTRAFLEASVVSERINSNDPMDILFTSDIEQPEVLAAHIEGIRNSAPNVVPEAFRNLSYEQIEDLLENNPQAYTEGVQFVQRQYELNRGKWRTTEMNDQLCMNRHLEMIDESGAYKHENIRLEKASTRETGERLVLDAYDENGDVVSSFIVKLIPVRDESGNIVGWKGCVQPLEIMNEKDDKQQNQEEKKEEQQNHEDDGTNDGTDDDTGDGTDDDTGDGTDDDTGDEPTGDEPTGDEPTGDTPPYDGKTDVLPGEEGDGWTRRPVTHEEPENKTERTEESGEANDNVAGSSSHVAEDDFLNGGDTGGGGETDAHYDGSDTPGWHGPEQSTEQGTQNVEEPPASEVNDTLADPSSAAPNNNAEQNQAAGDEAMNRFEQMQDGQ